MSVSIAIIQDRRYKKKFDRYPMKLRVIAKRKTIDFPTIYNITKESYKKLSASHISEELKELRTSLNQLEDDAKEYAARIKPFSLSSFETGFIKPNPKFVERKKRKSSIDSSVVLDHEFNIDDFDFSKFKDNFPILEEESKGEEYMSEGFTIYIKNLLIGKQIGTALRCQTSYYSLKKFRGDLPLYAVNKMYLTLYENWIVEKGGSVATAGIDLKALRAVLNDSIDNRKVLSREYYPFGRKKYRIPTKKSNTTALLKEDIKALYEYEPEKYNIKKGQAYWFFCFFGNGMNPSDMATLKYENIHGDFIRFIRNKTKITTKENPKIITVFLHEKIKAIIDEWGNDDRNPDNYIFPILTDDMNSMQQYTRIRTLTKFLNDSMSEIIDHLESEKKVNNKVCRKTVATMLKREGASLEFIQDTLGHLSKKTTELYTEDYEDDTKKKFAMKVSSF